MMFIDKREFYTDIYPFINNAAEAGWSQRITVHTGLNSDYTGKIQYNNLFWTEEQFKQLADAFAEAFKIVRESSTTVA